MNQRDCNRKRRQLLLAGASAALGATGLAHAAPGIAEDNYPSKPLSFICPWPAGGTADVTMRALTRVMSQLLGQPVIFENRAGASGMIGAKILSSAAPDGYTIGQIPLSVVRFPQLGTANFDPLKDFTYLARTSGQTFGIVVRPESPYKTLADLVADAKTKPGRITFGTSGVAGATHVGMEEFCLAAGVRMNHIPYKGGAPALIDLIGGQLDVLADSSSWAQYVDQGKLRLLATWGEQRPPRFNQAPTLKDLGYNVVVDAPNGVGAPAGLNPRVAAKLRDVLRKAVNSPEFKLACDRIDAPIMYLDADDYRKYIVQQYAHETQLIATLKLKEQIIK